MLLRIALIVALVAVLGMAAVSHFMVAEKITTLTTERDDYQSQMQTAQQNAAAADKKARKATEDLRTTSRDLANATNALALETTRANQQEKRANETAATLENVARERNEAMQELAAWRATGLTPNQISNVVATLRRVSLERDVFADEKEVLLRNTARLEARLLLYEQPSEKVVMREGLKGKIVAVDPKWDFVVVDIGAEQGALDRGEMIVSRDGKMVAKIRLAEVRNDRSIANVIPDWRLEDIREGDQVIY